MNKILGYVVSVFVVISLVGCSGLERAEHGDELVWTNTSDRPEWTMESISESGGHYRIVGMSDKHASEKSAREAALLNASANAVAFLRKTVEKNSSSTREEIGNDEEILRSNVSNVSSEKASSKGLVKEMTPAEWYIEQWRDREGRMLWSAFVLAEVKQSNLK